MNGPDVETGEEVDESPFGRLRTMIASLLEAANPEEFLEHTKLELFHDQVFCFTPKGRLIALPTGSDPSGLRVCGSYRHR